MAVCLGLEAADGRPQEKQRRVAALHITCRGTRNPLTTEGAEYAESDRKKRVR